MQMHTLFSLNRLLIIALGIVWCCDSCSGQQDDRAREIKRFFYQLDKRVDDEQRARILLEKHRARPPKNEEERSAHLERQKVLVRKASKIDGSNLEWLKEVIENNSFPSFSDLGLESAEKFFVLILHADRDPEFQLSCLEKLRDENLEWPDSYGDLIRLRVQMVNPHAITEEEQQQSEQVKRHIQEIERQQLLIEQQIQQQRNQQQPIQPDQKQADEQKQEER